jgi:hypothetical protein
VQLKPSRLPDADEIARLVALGRERGVIRFATDKAEIVKNGEAISTSGPLRSQWIDITPALAKTWLENNFRNRPLREDTVKAYARDMILGLWVATHQGIAFNDKDELIDGQHRLSAIVLANKTVRMMVTFGLPSQIAGKQMTTMDAVDRGATRSVGQTLDVYRLFEPSISWVIAHRSKEIGIRQTGVMAGFAFAIMADNPTMENIGSSETCFMFEKLVTGADRERKTKPKSPSKTWAKFSPIARLRAFLTSDEAKLLTRSLDRGVAELSLQAILLESQSKPVSKLEMSLDGANHFRAVQNERVKKVAALFALPA